MIDPFKSPLYDLLYDRSFADNFLEDAVITGGKIGREIVERGQTLTVVGKITNVINLAVDPSKPNPSNQYLM